MWSLGVLFYFMLNREFPFCYNKVLNSTHEEQGESLLKMSKNFSYRESVLKTKRRRVENCNADVEDLFSRVF